MHYGSLIFGSLLMLFGLSILVNVVFGVYIPIMRLAWGFFLIYAGIALINKTSFYKKGCHFYFNKSSNLNFNNNSWFNSSNNYHTNNANTHSPSYQTLFGNQTIDLQSYIYTNITTNTPETVHIKTVFGTSHVLIDANIPTQIITHTTFGNVIFPDHSSTLNGSFTYLTHNMQPKLILYVATVFGTTIIKEK